MGRENRYGWPEIPLSVRMHDFTPSLRPTVCFHCWLTRDNPVSLHIDRAPYEFCGECKRWCILDGLCLTAALHGTGTWLHWKDRLDKDPMVTRWLPSGRRVGRRHRGKNPEAAAKTLAESGPG